MLASFSLPDTTEIELYHEVTDAQSFVGPESTTQIILEINTVMLLTILGKRGSDFIQFSPYVSSIRAMIR